MYISRGTGPSPENSGLREIRIFRSGQEEKARDLQSDNDLEKKPDANTTTIIDELKATEEIE